MLEEVQFIDVEPRALAVVKRTATLDELPTVMPAALGVVWEHLRAHDVPTGQTVALYFDQVFNFEAGVEVFGPVPPHDEVYASETPGGRVATITLWGPYEELSLAHTAIARACVGSGLRVAGPCWEVYGDWSDDPARLRTDVFYLLRD
jgi:effector-binding domain-containing protein